MGVNPQFSLSTKFVLLALLNVAMLAVVFVLFVRWQLSEEFESFLMTTARERIGSVSRSLALELQQHDRAQWSRLLARYSQEHGVQFALVRDDGAPIAGPKLELPKIVEERLVRPPRRGFTGMGMGREKKGPPPDPNDPRERELKSAGNDFRQRYLRFVPFFTPAPPSLVVTGDKVPYWVGVRLMVPPAE